MLGRKTAAAPQRAAPGQPLRPQKEPPLACSNCGAALQEGQEFCSSCGQRSASPSVSNPPASNYSFPAFSAAANPAAAAAVAPPGKKSKKKFVVLGIAGVIMIAAVVAAAFLISSLLTREDFRDMFGKFEGESWCEIALDGS